jgi:hypothetical protein
VHRHPEPLSPSEDAIGRFRVVVRIVDVEMSPRNAFLATLEPAGAACLVSRPAGFLESLDEMLLAPRSWFSHEREHPKWTRSLPTALRFAARLTEVLCHASEIGYLYADRLIALF